ncbi:hypothetical protein QFZ70_003093 [Arthrobacter sp. V1I9]|nr:hypothetical protein [Arthrobacter sp. V1I9]
MKNRTAAEASADVGGGRESISLSGARTPAGVFP